MTTTSSVPNQTPSHSPNSSMEQVEQARVSWWHKIRRERLFLAYCLGVSIAFVLLFVAQMLAGWVGKTDFVALYTGGELVRLGNGHSLYDLAVQAAIQRRLLSPYDWVFAGGVLAYYYPPFVAVLFAPLTHLSLQNAFYMWSIANVILLAVWTAVVLRYIKGDSMLKAVIIALVVAAFVPTFETLLKGQTSILVLFALTMTYMGLKRGHDFLAGAALGLTLIKPPYVILVLLFLIWYRRWRALAGFATAAIGLVAIAWLLVGGEGLRGYGVLTQHIMTEESFPGIYPATMPNISGTLYRLNVWVEGWIGMGFPLSFQRIAWIVVSTTLMFLMVRQWRRPWDVDSHPFDLRFAMLLIVTLLVNPHLNHHDLALLMLVALVLLGHVTTPQKRRSYESLAGWTHIALVLVLPLGYMIRSQAIALLLLLIFVILLFHSRRTTHADQTSPRPG